MQTDLTSGSAIAVMGVGIAAISSLVGQWLTIKKVTAEAVSRRDDARVLLEQTKAEAELTKVKMESAAAVLELKVDANKSEVSRVAQLALVEAKELKDLVKENSVMTEEGAASAQKAYHEANQVNVWRADIQKEIRDLSAAVKALYENRESDGVATKGISSQGTRIEKTVVKTLDKVDQVKELLTADDAAEPKS